MIALLLPALATPLVAADLCIPPTLAPASRVLYLGPAHAEHSDPLPLRALLVDESGRPLAARVVAFTFAGTTQNATTGADGTASSVFQAGIAPGAAPVVAAFAGEAGRTGAQTSAMVTIGRDHSRLMLTSSPFLASGEVTLVARLTHGGADHPVLPIANRPIEFQLGTRAATSTTDTDGFAKVTFSLGDSELGPTQLVARFVGDTYYVESQDARSGFVYSRSSFVIWGGNVVRPAVGQTVNFWGSQWSQQVSAGEYSAHSDFKGFATTYGAADLCQPAARLASEPLLVQGCWDSKSGQIPPPVSLPRFISAIVSTAITKTNDVVYGNIAGAVLIEVSPDPAYGADPGKPGFGKIIAVLSDGANLFARPVITSAIDQPSTLLPGQVFPIRLTLTNGGNATATAINVQAMFDGSTPSAGSADMSSLAVAESRAITFDETTDRVATRGASETSDAYVSRLAAEDGRLVTSEASTRFADVSGAYFAPVVSVGASRIRVPILTMRISGLGCALPGATVPYTIDVTNIGGAPSAAGRVVLVFPDATVSEFPLPSIASGTGVVLSASWVVPAIAPKPALETDAAYRARLASFDGRALLLNASASWNDAIGNQYGATTAQFLTIERLPNLTITTGSLPSSIAPGQVLSPSFTIANLGSIASATGRLMVTMPDGSTTELPFGSLLPGASTTLATTWTVPPVAARGAADSDADYRARLASFDTKQLLFTGAVTWDDSNANRYGAASATAQSTERLPILTLSADTLSPSVVPGQALTPSFTVQNYGSASAATGTVVLSLPDGSSVQLIVPPLAPAASATLSASWGVPLVEPRAQAESETAYRARLVALDGKRLTFSASVTWSDSVSNAFGAMSVQSETTERLPILTFTASALPATVLPADTIAPQFTIQNAGSGAASGILLRVTQPDGSEASLAPLTLGAGATIVVEGPSYSVPSIAPRASGELESAYRERLSATDGATRAFAAALNWSDGIASYGPLSQQGSTTEVVPILSLTMSAPAEVFSGDPIAYTVTIANSGRATAQAFDLAVTMPDGTVQRPAATIVPPSSTTNLTLTFTVPEAQPQGSLSASAILRWSDGRANGYGDLTAGATTLAKPKNLAPLVNAGPDQILALPATQIDNSVTLRQIATGFNSPVGIDYHPSFNKVLMSVNYPSGSPYNLELIASDGSRTRFSALSGLTEELKIATAKDDGNGISRGGFAVGEAFTGSGVAGVIVRISADGNTVRNPWVKLAPETGLMRGSLYVDRTGIFGGDLIAVTTTGGVWRVNEAGQATKLASLGVHLEGLITLPNDPVKYGPWAGKIVIGAEDQSRFYTVDAQGNSAFYSLGIPPEDIDLIPANENFYGVDYAGQRLWGASASGFRNLVGDLIVSQESPGIMWHLRWNGTQFVKTQLASVSQWEHVTFAPVGIVNVTAPGVTGTFNGTVSDDGKPAGAAVTQLWTTASGPAEVAFANRASKTTTAIFSEPGTYVLRLTATDTVLTSFDDVTVTVDPRNTPPVPNAGADQSIRLPGNASLAGSATDDGFPRGSSLTYAWSKINGPGTTTFTSGNQAATTVSFSTFGTYILRLTVSDGNLFASDDVVISVSPQNLAPSVNAGPDQTITQPASASLLGNVSDDGLPAGSSVTYAWTQMSGPAAATIDAPSSLVTTASFAVPGVYVFRLTASDSQFAAADDVSITVQAGPALSLSPAVVGPNVTGTTQILTAVLTSAGSPVANAQVTFTVTGPNALSRTVNSAADGSATFTYTGAVSGTDSVQATAQVNGTTVASPNSTIGWITPVESVSMTTILGRFFTGDGSGSFNIGPTAQPVFSQMFPTINFNPPAGTVPGNTSPVGVTTRPFTNVTTDVNGNFTGLIVAQGNNAQAGVGSLFNFNAVFTGTLVVGTPGAVQFNFFSDDGFIFGVANGATRVSGPMTGAPANGRTPFQSYPVMGAYNFVTAPVGNSVTVNFPAPGAYPFELDYSEGQGGALAMTMARAGTSGSKGIPPTGVLTITPNSFPLQLVNTPVSLTVTATDASGAAVAYLAVTLNITGANQRQLSSITDATGKATFTYVAANTGGDSLQATASFTGMTGYSNVVTIQRGSNKPPTVDAGPDQIITLPKSATLTGTITDDGLPLNSVMSIQWTLVSGPAGIALGSASQTTTTATFTTAGTYVLRLTANDSNLATNDDVTVLVQAAVPGNSPPNVNAGPDQTITSPSAAILSGLVSDDGVPAGGGLAITWSKVSGPGTVSFADPTRSSTTATFGAAGSYVLRLTASDTQLTASDDVTVLVNGGNVAPVVNAGADRTISSTATTLTGTVTDDGRPNGTLTVVWSKVSGPGSVTFAPATTLTTQVTFSAAGVYVLRLGANDSQLVGTDDITITVTPPNQAPVVNAGSDQSINLPNAATLNGTATDDGLPLGVALVRTWSRVSGPGTVTFANPNAAATTATFSASGEYYLRLTATDSLLSSSDEVRVVVFDPITGPPPGVAITAPADGGDVKAPVNVEGTVSAGSWRLEYVLQSGDGTQNGGWTEFARGNGAASGTLAQFDPTLLLNGVYAIRLSATDSSNQSSNTTSTVVVSREMKIGAFTLAFSDLNVPVAGIPMRVTRTYDSRDKRVGDFGVGWNLDLKNIRLQKSDVLGKNWEETLTPGFLPKYCVERRKPHVVTVSFPDGKVYKFQAKTNPQCQQADAIRQADVVFEQLSTTAATSGAQLTVADPYVMFTGSMPGAIELNETENLDVFNPVEFTLRTRDGYVYVVHQQAGLRKMTDPAGNTLTVTANGIIHSSGRSISFTRDGLGRITRITDPSGNALVYAYDAKGDLVTFEDREHGLSAYTYDGTHGLLTIRDPNGRMPVKNEYDASGRLSRTIDADGAVINYTHSLAASQEIVTDRLGNATVYDYDADGNVVATTDPLGGVTRHTFDAAGNKLTDTNPLGQTTTYTYDSNGNVTSTTDALGNVKRDTFDAMGRRVTSTDALGNVTTSTFDAAGNLARVEDPLHNATTYTYDARGLRLTETNSLGCVKRYEYDGNGNRTREIDEVGRATSFTYDGSGNVLTETRTRTTTAGSETLTTSYQYDRENRLVKTTYPDGSFTSEQLDGAGQRIQVTDELGNAVEYNYNAAGDLTVTEHPDGSTEAIGYDAEGRRTSSTDRAGRVSTIGYDKAGRISSITKPDGSLVRNVYDAAGRLIEMIDPRGNRTAYTYDAAGRNLTVTDATGAVTRFAFDAAGNKTSTTDPNGDTTTFAYDALNRLVKTTFPDGTFKSVVYDAAGRKTAETDQGGVTTRFEYDCAGQLSSVTDALSQITSFTYDELGRRTSQTDAEGRKTEWQYDKRGRVTRRTLPLGQFETTAYDASGHVITSTDFNGAATTYTYDVLGRVKTVTYADGTSVSTTYNTAGKPERVTDGRGTTVYAYDAADRTTSITQPGTGTVTYTYDLAGNRTAIATAAGTTTYSYDAANRLATATSPTGGVTRYSYDLAGNRTELRAANGVVTTYSHDRLKRLTQVVNKRSDGSILSSFAYTLAPAGNRLRVVEGSGRAVDYTYDAIYRLVNESVADPARGNSVTAWTYDKAGNRLTETKNGVVKTYTYDSNDRMLTEGSTSYTYDANGSVLTKVAAAESVTYQYDAAIRLKRLATSGSASTVIDYGYDPHGNRVRRTLNGTVVSNYLLDVVLENAQVLLETDGGGGIRASYVRGDELLSMQRAGAQSFYVTDGQMSTRALTDAGQAVTDEYVFDAFGGLVSRTGSTANEFLYTGEQFDSNAGLYYLRARYYDPSTGRFTSFDSFNGNPFEPQSLHKYAYAHNDPINRIDPSGHFSLIETQTAIDVMQTISKIFPTLLRGFVIAKGVDVFYRPGFAMRNLGLEMMTFCVSSQCFDAAQNMIEGGHAMIEMGSRVIKYSVETLDRVDAFTGILKFGYGCYQMREAIVNAPIATRTILTPIGIEEHLEIMATTNSTYFYHMRYVQIKNVHFELQRSINYAKVLEKGLKLAHDIYKYSKDDFKKLKGAFDILHPPPFGIEF